MNGTSNATPPTPTEDEVDERFKTHFLESALVHAYKKKIDELEYKIERLEACMASLMVVQGRMVDIDYKRPPIYRRSDLNPATFYYCKECKELSRPPIDNAHACMS